MTNTKQTNVRLSVMTRRQLDTLAESTGMNQSEVIQTAIDRLYQQEKQTMNANDEYLEIVDTYDMNVSGTIDLRLARINNDWFVYRFDMNAAQITKGDSFARHSASGVRYLFDPMTEQEARQEYQRRIADWESSNR